MLYQSLPSFLQSETDSFDVQAKLPISFEDRKDKMLSWMSSGKSENENESFSTIFKEFDLTFSGENYGGKGEKYVNGSWRFGRFCEKKESFPSATVEKMSIQVPEATNEVTSLLLFRLEGSFWFVDRIHENVEL